MSPKKTILRALAESHSRTSGTAYTRPTEIPGFPRDPERFQQAVNVLLKDRLIEGRRDEEGRMTVAVNPHRLAEVQRTLRPLWAHPALWGAIVLLGALGAGFILQA